MLLDTFHNKVCHNRFEHLVQPLYNLMIFFLDCRETITGRLQDYNNRWRLSDDGQGGILENKLGDWTSSQAWKEIEVDNGIMIQNVQTGSFLGAPDSPGNGAVITLVESGMYCFSNFIERKVQ